MRHSASVLCVLDAAASLVLVHCAVISHENGSTAYTVILGSLAVLFAVSLAHTSYLADRLRNAEVRLEAASRPAPMFSPLSDSTVRAAMAGWCCDTAVLTAGADHDPVTCTRKDTSA
ncbi:hypothetical protein [Streptomyces sp. NPDC102487]|uniref:hypothetical protein n=1 Tax=Streptomyces sp. NPDC102487 TaxID=3366182 RepID=UPI0038135E4D